MSEGLVNEEAQIKEVEDAAAERVKSAEHLSDLTEAIDTVSALPFEAEVVVGSVLRTKDLVEQRITEVLGEKTPLRESLLDEAHAARNDDLRKYGTAFTQLAQAASIERHI